MNEHAYFQMINSVNHFRQNIESTCTCIKLRIVKTYIRADFFSNIDSSVMRGSHCQEPRQELRKNLEFKYFVPNFMVILLKN